MEACASVRLRDVRRKHVIAACCFVAAAAALTLPETQTRQCEASRPVSLMGDGPTSISGRGYTQGNFRRRGFVLIGSFYTLISVATLTHLLILRRSGRIDYQEDMQRQVWRFVRVLTLQACIEVFWPWLFSICPSRVRDWHALLMAIDQLALLGQSYHLSVISLLRLSVIGADSAVMRGQIFMRCGYCSAFLSWVLLYASQFLVGALFLALAGVACCLFHCNALAEYGSAMFIAREEALRNDGDITFYGAAQMLAILSGFSAASNLAFLAALSLDMIQWTHFTFALHEMTRTAMIVADTSLALYAGGLLGKNKWAVGQSLRSFAELLEGRRHRQILNKMKEAAKAMSGPACTLAAMFEGVDEEVLLTHALTKFRCISWQVLKENSHLVIDGGTIAGNSVDEHLYDLSMPCRLAQCDAFWSHSWHDDGKLKWAALSEWCEEFTEHYGRPPLLWFDRVCINQTDVRSDLQCLPIFLAGCNSLLITCGKTYTTRLWCCTELFVYMVMLNGDRYRLNPVVKVLGDTPKERAKVIDSWLNFDITQCDCFFQEDKTRILDVVEEEEGGTLRFNKLIHELVQDVLFNELDLKQLVGPRAAFRLRAAMTLERFRTTTMTFSHERSNSSIVRRVSPSKGLRLVLATEFFATPTTSRAASSVGHSPATRSTSGIGFSGKDMLDMAETPPDDPHGTSSVNAMTPQGVKLVVL